MFEEKYTIISSFAKDLVSQEGSEQIQERDGGPALWISKTLDNLNVSYELQTPKIAAKIRIFVVQGNEKGEIISLDKIKLAKDVVSDVFIVSTIGKEFSLKDILKLKGFIALDAQGYIRTAKGKFFVPKEVEDRVDLLKVNKQEAGKLESSFLERQKKKLLIVSKGEDGFKVFSEGKSCNFDGIRVAASDTTIGAGDVLLTAFVVKLREGNTAQEAGEFAKEYVDSFLKKART